MLECIYGGDSCHGGTYRKVTSGDGIGDGVCEREREIVQNYLIIATDGRATVEPEMVIPEAVLARMAGMHVLVVPFSVFPIQNSSFHISPVWREGLSIRRIHLSAINIRTSHHVRMERETQREREREREEEK